MSEADVDQRIRDAVASDDPAALELIWDGYAARLYAFLVSRLRSRHDADDVLQEVFVKVAAQRSRLPGVANLQAYFFAMARNEVVTLIRRRKRRDAPVNPDDLWLVPGAPEVEADVVARLGAALGGLPEAQRAVVVLKVYQDMTFQEIAEALDIPLNTAASRYRYALEKLRELLREEWP